MKQPVATPAESAEALLKYKERWGPSSDNPRTLRNAEDLFDAVSGSEPWKHVLNSMVTVLYNAASTTNACVYRGVKTPSGIKCLELVIADQGGRPWTAEQIKPWEEAEKPVREQWVWEQQQQPPPPPRQQQQRQQNPNKQQQQLQQQQLQQQQQRNKRDRTPPPPPPQPRERTRGQVDKAAAEGLMELHDSPPKKRIKRSSTGGGTGGTGGGTGGGGAFHRPPLRSEQQVLQDLQRLLSAQHDDVRAATRKAKELERENEDLTKQLAELSEERAALQLEVAEQQQRPASSAAAVDLAGVQRSLGLKPEEGAALSTQDQWALREVVSKEVPHLRRTALLLKAHKQSAAALDASLFQGPPTSEADELRTRVGAVMAMSHVDTNVLNGLLRDLEHAPAVMRHMGGEMYDEVKAHMGIQQSCRVALLTCPDCTRHGRHAMKTVCTAHTPFAKLMMADAVLYERVWARISKAQRAVYALKKSLKKAAG